MAISVPQNMKAAGERLSVLLWKDRFILNGCGLIARPLTGCASILCHPIALFQCRTFVYLKFFTQRYNRSELPLYKNRVFSQHIFGSHISVPQRASNRPKKGTRAGCTIPAKIYIAASLGTILRSLFTKLPDPSLLLQSPIYVHTCVTCIQELWLNPDIGGSLVLIDGSRQSRKQNYWRRSQHT